MERKASTLLLGKMAPMKERFEHVDWYSPIFQEVQTWDNFELDT